MHLHTRLTQKKCKKWAMKIRRVICTFIWVMASSTLSPGSPNLLTHTFSLYGGMKREILVDCGPMQQMYLAKLIKKHCKNKM